ncbi:SMU1112c/YaeR family gloxylase I-like metalloprotein [Planctobacterium marinum]|uniref:SMU1112c/YaeR family gloxylase I-like metalloprotein n=1 Tax=Planctobacterium marinum TaxID=1631968 RepID=UPI001E3EB547|nr:VOC family protein [Planctobacterium marinum]MCC2605028.1 VOC family protein [Planctobacterium marinum]
MLSGMHHVAIICSDYGRSKHFYTEVLGLRVIAENYRAERDSYKLDLLLPDGTQIELFSFPEPPERPSQPEACGLRHISFRTESLQDSIRHLKQQDIEVEPVRIDPYTGASFTFFQDPDGLPLELYELKRP